MGTPQLDEQMKFIGRYCEFYDERGNKHSALITAVHGVDEFGPMSVNLVHVVSDPLSLDQYGRQLARRSSVVRLDKQYAPGMYFKLNGVSMGKE